MPPKSETNNDIEVTNSSGHNGQNKEELPLATRIKTRLISLMESLRLFLYDKEHKTIFGNSSSYWIKISIYYFFFYVCLALYYSGMVAVFAAIVSREAPTYWYHNSQMSVGLNFYIGMGFRPMPSITDVSLTVYNDTSSQNDTVATLRGYQMAYLTQNDPSNYQACSPTAPASSLTGSLSCQFSWTDIVTSDSHPCSDKNMYGWPAGQPCVLIKLNKIYGWVPDSGSVINQVVNATGQPVLSVDQRENNIFITCNGTDAIDKDALGNNMIYYSLLHPLGYPSYGGIPYYFFPYMNTKEYTEPFVLVQFTALPLFTLINIECRVWVPNIQQLFEGTTSRGIVRFNIYRSNQNKPNTN